MAMKCLECGNTGFFVYRQVVVEENLVDGNGEYIKTKSADTRDLTHILCQSCMSAEIEDGGEK